MLKSLQGISKKTKMINHLKMIKLALIYIFLFSPLITATFSNNLEVNNYSDVSNSCEDCGFLNLNYEPGISTALNRGYEPELSTIIFPSSALAFFEAEVILSLVYLDRAFPIDDGAFLAQMAKI